MWHANVERDRAAAEVDEHVDWHPSRCSTDQWRKRLDARVRAQGHFMYSEIACRVFR